MTFAVPLKVTHPARRVEQDPETGAKTIRDIKTGSLFGDIPLMTENGTFIINGTERVIVSQLHRSPGAFFHSEDKTLFVAQIIPYRGSWVEFERREKPAVNHIDRKRKFLATVFLRALGLRGADEIITSTPSTRSTSQESRFWASTTSWGCAPGHHHRSRTWRFRRARDHQRRHRALRKANVRRSKSRMPSWRAAAADIVSAAPAK
jgi:DNA-directed RNA polymerase beta subunit